MFLAADDDGIDDGNSYEHVILTRFQQHHIVAHDSMENKGFDGYDFSASIIHHGVAMTLRWSCDVELETNLSPR